MYIGRFAPSPTGPLHFGSLVAAVASYCDAKSNQGKWLVRIEDLDKPRTVKGATAHILNTLEAFGLMWDGEIVHQSTRDEIYADAFKQLSAKNIIYPCTCTRKEIADSSNLQGVDGLIYPKTCLKTPSLQTNADAAFRVIAPDSAISFQDAIQGKMTQHLSQDIGDFILKRKDGLFAYQLAVVVDDAAQDVTHIVRGADLLDSTPRQIYLQQQLGLPTPHYAHVPVVVNAQNEKLSKQTLAKPIAPESAPLLIFEALCFLGQHPPLEIKNATLAEVWCWAIENWQITSVPKQRTLVANHFY